MILIIQYFTDQCHHGHIHRLVAITRKRDWVIAPGLKFFQTVENLEKKVSELVDKEEWHIHMCRS